MTDKTDDVKPDTDGNHPKNKNPTHKPNQSPDLWRYSYYWHSLAVCFW
ncbi:hypothetical protein [Moraxella catarrhalis]|nr:hypothetical protein [Moraxella catarrhalis]